MLMIDAAVLNKKVMRWKQRWMGVVAGVAAVLVGGVDGGHSVTSRSRGAVINLAGNASRLQDLNRYHSE